jgi:hypothetical protein
MSKLPKPPEILDIIVDIVLAHKPKRKTAEKAAARRAVADFHKDQGEIRERQERIRENAKNIKDRIRRGN